MTKDFLGMVLCLCMMSRDVISGRSKRRAIELVNPILILGVTATMNTLGPFSRIATLRRVSPQLQGRSRLALRPAAINLSQVHARFAASSVSGRPGSQTIEHARQNVKEEVGNSLTDWARSIAGGVFTVDSVKPSKDSFVCILSCEWYFINLLSFNHSMD